MRSSSDLPIAWVRFTTFSLRRIFCTWFFTVSGLILRIAPISKFALAEVDPLQDVELAHREHALAGRLVRRGAAVGVALELRAHPRRMQRRREELREVGLARAGLPGRQAKVKRLIARPSAVVHAVHQQLRRAEALELAGERAARRAELRGRAPITTGW